MSSMRCAIVGTGPFRLYERASWSASEKARRARAF